MLDFQYHIAATLSPVATSGTAVKQNKTKNFADKTNAQQKINTCNCWRDIGDWQFITNMSNYGSQKTAKVNKSEENISWPMWQHIILAQYSGTSDWMLRADASWELQIHDETWH